jgi:hypothetical protein
LNGPWTLARAETFAKHLIQCDAKNIEDRITVAYQTALGRQPETKELTEIAKFIKSAGANEASQRDAWVDFCHVLLNTNEFLYIN